MADLQSVKAGSCLAIVQRLGPAFAARVEQHDRDDSFVAENYEALRQAGFMRAAVPSELGGGGASVPELGEALRTLARHCTSTALAASMHTHVVAALAWRWRHGDTAVEPLLRRLASEDLVLVTSGGSDWIHGSGTAAKVDGGYRMSGRKVFASGSPSKGLFLTTALEGETILHFAVPLGAKEVTLHDNWKVMGMRGTGSQDVTIDGFFVPDQAVAARRPKGKYAKPILVAALHALPLVNSVYVGGAEAIRDKAVALAKGKSADPAVQMLAGEVDSDLAVARWLLDRMLAEATRADATVADVNPMLAARTQLGQLVCRIAERSMELAGGGAFFRSAGVERLFRDLQAVRFHPVQEKPQRLFTGRVAFGLPPDP